MQSLVLPIIICLIHAPGPMPPAHTATTVALPDAPDEPREGLGPCSSSRFDPFAGEGTLILTAAPGESIAEFGEWLFEHGAEVTYEYSFGVAAYFDFGSYHS